MRTTVTYLLLLTSTVSGIVSGAGCKGSSRSTGDASPSNNFQGDPLVISAASPRPRTGTLSVNYWSWPASYGPSVAGTETMVAALKPAMLRVGGYNNDVNAPDPFDDTQFDRMIAYARAIGAEPIVQVPLLADTHGQPPTGATAAAMVSYANVVKGYQVRYFSIGNEPDLYATQGLPSAPSQPARPGYSPQDFCAAARDFVPQMKAVDPTIQIVGPDLSYQYQWLAPILSGCGDLFDIVAIHRYPFSAPQATVAAAAADIAKFRSLVTSVRGMMEAAGQGAKPLAITEMNIAYDATPAGVAPGATPGTVPAALWLADIVGTGLDLGLFTAAVWAISDPDNYSFGLISLPPAHVARPAYYAYALYGDHVGPTLVDVTSAPSGVDAHASRNAAGDATEIIVVNWNSAPAPLAFQVTGLATSPPTVVYEMPPLSMAAVEVPDRGVATAVIYGEAQHAAGQGPEPLAQGASARADGGTATDTSSNSSDGLDPGARCSRNPVTATAITTSGTVAAGALSFGAGSAAWGSFTYAGSGQPAPTLALTPDGDGLQISASLLAPVAGSNNYAGVGLYFNSASCLDASTYTGIAFDVSGDLGGCALTVGVSSTENVSVVDDAVRGSCTPSTTACYAPTAAVTLGAATIQVPFSSLTAGMPIDKVDTTTVITIQWQVQVPLVSDAGGCAASFAISRVAFY